VYLYLKRQNRTIWQSVFRQPKNYSFIEPDNLLDVIQEPDKLLARRCHWNFPPTTILSQRVFWTEATDDWNPHAIEFSATFAAKTTAVHLAPFEVAVRHPIDPCRG
jgi:hypothetical protein